jgi:hypothetical protein
MLPKTDLKMAPVDLGDYSKVDSDGENEGLQYSNDRSATLGLDRG